MIKLSDSAWLEVEKFRKTSAIDAGSKIDFLKPNFRGAKNTFCKYCFGKFVSFSALQRW